MNSFSRKAVSVGLVFATALWFAGSALTPLANAAGLTSSQVQSILALLQSFGADQSTINNVQAALRGQAVSTTGGASCYTFTKDLTLGSRGADVKALQRFLNGEGYVVAATGSGSVGHETEYFGPATKAALAKYQAASGIKPAAGFFGPLTMKAVNAACTPTTTTTTTTTTGTPLTVTVASDNPGAANVAAGAVNSPVLKLTFTAGSQAMTVTNLILTRYDLSQDSDLSNVYLYQGSTRLATNLGFNNGKITFSNGAGLFTVPANSSVEIAVTADISTSAGTGHIFELGIAAATITSTGGTFSGTFPVMGNKFTVASVSNLATLTISGAATSSINVNAGQTNFLIGQFNAQAGNNPVKVTYLKFTNIGSVQTQYIQNIKLMNGSTQLGATVPTLGSDNTATFNLSAAPLMLTSGQTVVLSLYADIMGGVSRTFQFSVQQASDIQAVDTMYGVGIGATAGSGLTFPISFYNASINAGGVVASIDANSPTTYLIAGNTNQVLAEFDVLASGDTVKFNELDFKITGSSSTIRNLRVVDDQGTQIGTTLTSTSTTSSFYYAAGSGNLNYIIPANVTRVLTVYGDLDTSNTGTLQVQFAGNNTSAQSYTTYSSITVGTQSAYSLSILASGSNLAAGVNYGLGTPNISAGTSNQEVGSFTLTAGQINSINLTGVTLTIANNSTVAGWLRNVRVMYGSTQLGTTYPTVTAAQTPTFNSSAPITVSANGTLTLNVYADVSNSATATTTAGLITLTSVNASTVGGNAVTAANAPVTGQTVSFNTGGTMTGAISVGTPNSQYVGMSVTGVTVAQYQFNTSVAGSATLTQLVIYDASSTATSTATTSPSGDHQSFYNYRLVSSSQSVLATAVESTGGVLTFNLSGIALPANSQNAAVGQVNLVADVNSYPYATSSAAHAYMVYSFQYTNPGGATTSYPYAMGNLFTVYANSLNVTNATGWSTNSASPTGAIVGEFNFVAGTSTLTVNQLNIQSGGSLVTTYSSSTVTVSIADGNGNVLATTTLASTTASSSLPLTFKGVSGWQISAANNGTAANLLVVKITSYANGPSTISSQQPASYNLYLNNVKQWNDGYVNVTNLDPNITSKSNWPLSTGVSFTSS